MTSYAAAPLRPAAPTPTYGTVQTSSIANPVVTSSPYGAASGSMAPAQWAKYSQMMTQYDPQRKGFLSGAEARGILMQSGLATNILAQIWNLSDHDCDGNLNTNEFCVAMYLTELARTGNTLPSQLPPSIYLPPPSGAAPSMVQSPSGGQLASTPDKPQKDEANEMTSAEKKSFEDRRQENFKKGEAELERRRQMLQEQLKADEEARMAVQRAEEEKREKERQEIERKRQEELQKQLEKQQQLEKEREEARNKAIEQREAARLELERQRKAEWERQRRGQLTHETEREKGQLELRRGRVTDLKFEAKNIDEKREEVNAKALKLKESIATLTAAIDAMKQTRDLKVAGIEDMKKQYVEANGELTKVHTDRERLKQTLEQMTLSDPVSDELRQLTIQQSQRQQAVDRLKAELAQLHDFKSSRQQAAQDAKEKLEAVKNTVQEAEQEADSLKQSLADRRQRYRAKKHQPTPQKQMSVASSGWDETIAVSSMTGQLINIVLFYSVFFQCRLVLFCLWYSLFGFVITHS